MTKLKSGLIILLFIGIVTALAGWKGYQIGVKMTMADWNKEKADNAIAVSKANDAIIKDRKVSTHENKNRDLDASRAYGCSRGWVRELDRCATLRR